MGEDKALVEKRIRWSGFVQICGVYTGSFPNGPLVKNLPANAWDTGDAGSIPGLGRSPGGGTGDPLQYSCLKNPLDRGAWWDTVQRVTKSGYDWAKEWYVWYRYILLVGRVRCPMSSKITIYVTFGMLTWLLGCPSASINIYKMIL